jgi:hypothetical protein
MNMDQMAAKACFMVEPLMIDLTSVPATQNPSRPRMVCTATMAVVTAATDETRPWMRDAWRKRPERQQPQQDERHAHPQTQRGRASRLYVLVWGGSRAHDDPDSFGGPWAHAVSRTGTTLCHEHRTTSNLEPSNRIRLRSTAKRSAGHTPPDESGQRRVSHEPHQTLSLCVPRKGLRPTSFATSDLITSVVGL